jgi:hypothetical protein
MPTEPPEVYYAIIAPGGRVLDAGKGTIGEVDMLRETLRNVFPRCSMHVAYPPRIKDAPHNTERPL